MAFFKKFNDKQFGIHWIRLLQNPVWLSAFVETLLVPERKNHFQNVNFSVVRNCLSRMCISKNKKFKKI